MRIRTIRPEFWESPQVGKLSINARLTFIGLWNLADREGRLKDRPEHIAIKLFPYDRLKPAHLERWLDELARAGLIIRYRHAGQAYIAIPTWRRHQRPHPHEAPSELPPPPVPALAPRATQGSVADTGAGLSSPAAPFNGAPRRADPSTALLNAQLSVVDPQLSEALEVNCPKSAEIPASPYHVIASEVCCEQNEQTRDDGSGGDERRWREDGSCRARAAPVREPEWEEQDAWLKRFLRDEQKAFVGVHCAPLLSDYAFWCRLSEATGGLSRELLEVEFAKMALWLGEHPTRAPTVNGVKRFVARWLERAGEQNQRRMRDGN
jgi:hypothetical protein